MFLENHVDSQLFSPLHLLVKYFNKFVNNMSVILIEILVNFRSKKVFELLFSVMEFDYGN